MIPSNLAKVSPACYMQLMKRAYASSSREPDQSLLKPVSELIGGCTLDTAMQLCGLLDTTSLGI